MKFFKSPQRVITIFLALFIMLCCFLIIRLEIKAANLQSRWDEHQKSLMKNEDVLYDLNRFARSVKDKGTSIKLHNASGNMTFYDDRFECSSSGDFMFGDMSGTTEYFGFDYKSKTTYMTGIGNGTVSIGNKNDKNYLRITDDNIAMKSSIQNNTSGFLLSGKLGGSQIFSSQGNNKSLIELDKGKIGVQGSGNINIEGKILTMEDESGKCKIRMTRDDIQIICIPSKGPVFGVSLSPSTQSISIEAHDASINLEKDEIHFNAKGDINITSKSGNVNIKGKKVKVNE